MTAACGIHILRGPYSARGAYSAQGPYGSREGEMLLREPLGGNELMSSNEQLDQLCHKKRGFSVCSHLSVPKCPLV